MYLCLYCLAPATDAVDVYGHLGCFLLCASCAAKMAMMLNVLGSSSWRFLGIEDLADLPMPAEINMTYQTAGGPPTITETPRPLDDVNLEQLMETIAAHLKDTRSW